MAFTLQRLLVSPRSPASLAVGDGVQTATSTCQALLCHCCVFLSFLFFSFILSFPPCFLLNSFFIIYFLLFSLIVSFVLVLSALFKCLGIFFYLLSIYWCSVFKYEKSSSSLWEMSMMRKPYMDFRFLAPKWTNLVILFSMKFEIIKLLNFACFLWVSVWLHPWYQLALHMSSLSLRFKWEF